MYAMDSSGKPRLLTDQNYVKDMHMLGSRIYFANTSPGDVSGLAYEDKNIYCFDTEGKAQKAGYLPYSPIFTRTGSIF